MILIYKDTVFDTDHISKMTLNEKDKSIAIYSSFSIEDHPTVINFAGDSEKESKYRALFAWFRANGQNIENLVPPPAPKK
jgi:hypothetical protein